LTDQFTVLNIGGEGETNGIETSLHNVNCQLNGNATRQAPTERGVVTAVGNDTVTVDWHLKQVESRGRAGDSMGKVYELPAMLIPDTRCPHCEQPNVTVLHMDKIS
jgi:hypothetical protein